MALTIPRSANWNDEQSPNTEADIPQFIRSRGAAIHSWLIVCCRLLGFEFFHRSVEIGCPIVRATNRFHMTAVAEGAAVVQAGLFDDVAHMVDELGPAIPSRLNITGGTAVVVGPRDMLAPRSPA